MLDIYTILLVFLGVRKRRYLMNSIFEDIKKDMDEFFDHIDSILDRDPDEVDVITDHLDEPISDDEADHLEMKAELHYGI